MRMFLTGLLLFAGLLISPVVAEGPILPPDIPQDWWICFNWGPIRYCPVYKP